MSALALALVPLLLGACRQGGSRPNSQHASPAVSAQPSAPAPASSSAISATADVIAAWRRYWQVYVAVGSQMQLPDERLEEVATGEELQALNAGFLAYRSQGQVIGGTIDLAPQVVSVAGSQATLSDCYASHILLYSRATGEPMGSEPPQRTLVTARMVVQGGVWKVAGIRHEGEGCAPAR